MVTEDGRPIIADGDYTIKIAGPSLMPDRRVSRETSSIQGRIALSK